MASKQQYVWGLLFGQEQWRLLFYHFLKKGKEMGFFKIVLALLLTMGLVFMYDILFLNTYKALIVTNLFMCFYLLINKKV